MLTIKRFFKNFKINKKIILLSSYIIIILLAIVLYVTFSDFRQSMVNDVANIKVAGMKYSMHINEALETKATISKNQETILNVYLMSLNALDYKYELVYKICSDSNCDNFVQKPNDLLVEYSSKTIDSINGIIISNGNKNIRIVVTNNTNTTYYIKFDINAGYVYNTLALQNLITTEYSEEDVTIAAIIDGVLSTTFPTTNDYDTTVECLTNKGPSNATGTATWNGTKWVVNITGADSGKTTCNVEFKVPTLRTKILGANNANVTSPLTLVGQQISAQTWDNVAVNTMTVSSYQNYYWTYGTGYTTNANGSYNLTGVSTLIYSSNYTQLVGKYIVSQYESGNGSSTNTQKQSTNLPSVIRVETATLTGLTYKQNYSPATSTEALLASTPDDYGISYYYRGAVENNYIVFANMCWRIVRVIGDGAIKLILYNYNPNAVANPCDVSQDGDSNAFARYNGASYITKFNANYSQNADIGFMYGTRGSTTYANEHANINKSPILTNLEIWYNAKLTSYENYLADTIWCNDKSMSTASAYLGYGPNQTYYKAYQRHSPITSSNPSLICPNDAIGGKLSKFTVNDTINGNGALNKKIGLLTADEISFAGTAYNVPNPKFYLYKNSTASAWYSLSPVQSRSSISDVFGGGNNGSLSVVNVSNSLPSSGNALRPSISLVSTTMVTGEGTSSNPYRVVD